MTDGNPIVLDRSCGACTLCCKILEISEFNKPKGKWCSHCKQGFGCTIYGSRPQECATFYCGYLTNEHLTDEWKPSKSKLILVAELDGNRIAAHVDPGRPNAWKDEPFYSTLKQWAMAAVPYRGQVVVCVNRRTYMIFPDRDVDLGDVYPDDRIITGESQTPNGVTLEAYKMHKDDPRLLHIAPQTFSSVALKK